MLERVLPWIEDDEKREEKEAAERAQAEAEREAERKEQEAREEAERRWQAMSYLERAEDTMRVAEEIPSWSYERRFRTRQRAATYALLHIARRLDGRS